MRKISWKYLVMEEKVGNSFIFCIFGGFLILANQKLTFNPGGAEKGNLSLLIHKVSKVTVSQ
ncbi:MAG: hypothetical protein ABIJ30_13175 [bacterium]